MEVLGLHLQLQALIPQAHRLLCQQSDLNSQVYETPRKFIMRHQPSSETVTLQMLHPPYSSIWIPTMVLQQSPTFISYENPRQDAEKSSHLDLRSIQNLTFHGYQSHCQNHPNQIPPTENS